MCASNCVCVCLCFIKLVWPVSWIWFSEEATKHQWCTTSVACWPVRSKWLCQLRRNVIGLNSVNKNMAFIYLARSERNKFKKIKHEARSACCVATVKVQQQFEYVCVSIKTDGPSTRLVLKSFLQTLGRSTTNLNLTYKQDLSFKITF